MTKPNTSTSSLQRFLLYAVILNLVFSVFTFVWSNQSSRPVVYVDAMKLMSGYKGMEQARKDLTGKSSQWQANLDTLRKEVEQSIADYETRKAKASTREVELMENLIESRQQQYTTYEQTVKEQFAKHEQQLTEEVLGKINNYIKEYGKEKGYEFILAATEYGNIVYAQDKKDITAEVLAGLNSSF